MRFSMTITSYQHKSQREKRDETMVEKKRKKQLGNSVILR